MSSIPASDLISGDQCDSNLILCHLPAWMVHPMLHLHGIVRYVVSFVHLVLYFGNTLILYIVFLLAAFLSHVVTVFLFVGGLLTPVFTTWAVVVYLILVYIVVLHLYQPVRLWKYLEFLMLVQDLSFLKLLLLMIHSDPLDIGLLSASAGCFQGPPAVESDVLNALLDHVIVCPVCTVSHIPCSVRPQLAYVLSVEFRKACLSI